MIRLRHLTRTQHEIRFWAGAVAAFVAGYSLAASNSSSCPGISPHAQTPPSPVVCDRMGWTPIRAVTKQGRSLVGDIPAGGRSSQNSTPCF